MSLKVIRVDKMWGKHDPCVTSTALDTDDSVVSLVSINKFIGEDRHRKRNHLVTRLLSDHVILFSIITVVNTIKK
jgi:hypothetical protein